MNIKTHKSQIKTILANIFDDEFGAVSSSSLHYNMNKSIDIIQYPCVHKDDLEPVSLIEPDMDRGPWIAGGAVLRWYQDQKVGENDIDVFCSSLEQANSIIDRLKSFGRYSVRFQSENAETFSYNSNVKNDTWVIQVIKRRYFTSLQDVLDNFDMSVCQIGTAGNEYVLGKDTARDIREKNLRMKYPLQPDAAKRMVKYWTYGYRPVDQLIDDVRNNPSAKQVFTHDEDYQNAF